MNPRGKKLEPKLKLDMRFDEALARFARTKPSEVDESIARAKPAETPPKRRTSKKEKDDLG
jgi:hypothetical protein